ncbi:sporulation protein [Cohnella sp. JJ-181]|uniref:sporulation protein n=1 Tax=Cohnella rhizoplanae TaxID=2974897 RepID=UPI0022FF7769|nr:sporulation protein [Cohnella sp. JJ-181]CAI6086418.1 Sporulation-control protein spo0M [Cohnella sp. JJ-181]
MSFFGRVLASVGIGAAKLDTVLEKSSYAQGEEIRGVVRVQGGSLEQRIDGIGLSVMTTYLREINDNKIRQHAVIAQYRVAGPLTVQPQEQREIPFSFVLPASVPISIGGGQAWIKTVADIQSAVDPTDEDAIHVVPGAGQRVVLEAVEQMGFRLRHSETVYAPRLGGSVPYVQELEWIPSGGRYRGRLDELELTFVGPASDGLRLLLQIDRRASGLSGFFAEAMDTDESFVRLTLTQRDLDGGAAHVAGILQGIIDQYAH